MESNLMNSFCEMTEEEMMNVEGGNIFDYLENFLTNRLVYTSMKIEVKYLYQPIEIKKSPDSRAIYA